MSKSDSTASVVYGDGIVTSTLCGAFNEKSANEYRDQLFGVVRQLNGRPFALLADIRGVQGGTPDAFDMVAYIVSKLPSMGLCAKAYVYQSPVVRGIMLQRVPKLKDMEYLFFTDFDEARKWLSDEYSRKAYI
jgi:hypothetical protein